MYCSDFWPCWRLCRYIYIYFIDFLKWVLSSVDAFMSIYRLSKVGTFRCRCIYVYFKDFLKWVVSGVAYGAPDCALQECCWLAGG